MYAQDRSLVEELKELISHHDMSPDGLGSGRADLHHELHAMHHSWFMECGDPPPVDVSDGIRSGVDHV